MGRRHFWPWLVFLGVLTAALLFPNLSYPFFEPDESRRAEIGREVTAEGHWLLPTLNHQPYYDKPPLFHWLVALNLWVFGPQTWAARLVPAGITWTLTLLLFTLGRRILGHRAALLGTLVFLLTPTAPVVGRVVSIDNMVSLCLTGMFLCAYLAVEGPEFRWRWWLASALGCAAGLLAKGPVVLVLFVPPVVAYGWLQRLPARPRAGHWAAYLIAAGFPAMVWYGATLLQDPRFGYEFIVHHNVQRFLGSTAHARGLWYYLPVLAAGLFPWTGFLPAVVRFLLSRRPDVRAARPPALGFLLLWAGWCVCFFSLSRGKLPLYVLPALPPLALLFGWFFEQALFGADLADWLRSVRTRGPLFLVPAVAAGAIGGALMMVRRRYLPADALPPIAGVAAAACALFLWLRPRITAVGQWGCAMAALALLWGVSAQWWVPAIAAGRSPLGLYPELADALERGDTGLVCNGQEWGSLAFHGQGDILDLRQAGTEELRSFLAGHERVVIVFPRCDLTPQVRGAIPEGRETKKLAETDGNAFYLVQKR